MSFAISWEADEIQAGGFLYFDAVTSWNRNYSGQVTKHPVADGGNVTDHYINNNPVFTMSAVISGTDLSIASINLVDVNGTNPSNVRPSPTSTLIKSTDDSLLMKYVPNVIGQFLPDKIPEVVVDDVRVDTSEGIQDVLARLQSGEGYNQITGQHETLIRPVNLYETDGALTLIRKLPATDFSFLVITAINFREDTESGYALFADITFEQVRFANIKKVPIPVETVQASLKNKATGKNSLGKGDSTPKSVVGSKVNTTGIFPI
jgi:hypothetical protein